MGNRTPKRAAPRRAAVRERTPWGRLLLLTIGVTLTVVAWGYLVVAAIDFGIAVRSGDTQGWWFLGTATVGAVACLFVALILAARILRLLGRRTRPADGSRGPSRHSTGTRSS